MTDRKPSAAVAVFVLPQNKGLYSQKFIGETSHEDAIDWVLVGQGVNENNGRWSEDSDPRLWSDLGKAAITLIFSDGTFSVESYT